MISLGSPNRGTSRRISPPWTSALTSPRSGEPERRPLRPPAQATVQEEAERPLQRRETQDHQRPEHDQPPDPRQRDRVDQPSPAHDPRRLPRRSFGRQRLGQAGQDEHPGDRREGGPDQERQAEPPRRVDRQRQQQAAQERPEHEPEAERHADQAHAARPVLGLGHVGHVGLRDQDVPPRGAVEHPRQEHHGEVARQAEHQERQRRARLADDQQGAAAVAVAQAAEDRPRHELAHRVSRVQEADLDLVQPVLLGERGQQGHHDAEAEQVHQHDRDDHPERRHQRRSSPAPDPASATAPSP